MPFAAEKTGLLIGGKRHGVNTPDVRLFKQLIGQFLQALTKMEIENKL